MTNTLAISRSWTEFVASRAEFPCGDLLLRQFNAGEVTRLCDCGCNSYEFRASSDSGIPSLVAPGEHGGSVFELEFQTDEWGKTVSFVVFVDASGNLSGLDVHYCGNTSPMPEHPRLAEPPFHIHGALAHEAQPVVAGDAPPIGGAPLN
jgi:hypothetical protein